MRQLPPPPGTVLEVVRGGGQPGERVVARLEVLQTDGGLTECRQQERAGRSNAEPGDLVRNPVGSTRLLLAPCVSLAPLPPGIPQVVGEKLRQALAPSPLFVLLDDIATERRAEAAYLSSAAADFVSRLSNVDEVLFPVLVQPPSKMVLNLEYYSVLRAQATDIDGVGVPQDELRRAWLQAGPSGPGVPPGFHRLPPQAHAWRATALGPGPAGHIIATDADSVRLLAFEYPGLREVWSAPLGPPERRRQTPWCSIIAATELQAAGLPVEAGAGTYLFSDERRPLLLVWSSEAGTTSRPRLQLVAPEVEPALERVWNGPRPEVRWWPASTHLADIFAPSFVDLDLDGRADQVWTDEDGVLRVKLATQRAASAFPGFGDVKAVQPPRIADERATLWLTEPVWHGERDRLYQARALGDELQVLWSSEQYAGTLTALASVDLNGDNAADLVAAESAGQGMRMYVYLSFAGERAARAAATSGGEKP